MLGKKDVLYVSISGYYTITLCGTTAGGPTPVLTLYFFASSTVVLRSFFAFKAKNDRRTTEERKAPVIENLKSGIDFVTVVTCQGVATRKLVVE